MKQITKAALVCLLAVHPVSAWQLDMNNRWQVRDYYQTVYPHGSDAAMEWTGSYTSGTPGTLAAAWLEATQARINFYRMMAGVPAEIVLDPALNAKCQQAALMMSANNSLSHTPPQSWLWWTADGFAAAANSNLSLGSSGAAAVDGYMADYGSAQSPSMNKQVGHRRWLLLPSTTVMASGDVPGDSGRMAANALWVDTDGDGPRPPSRDEFVAWPPAGHVPSDLVWSRWSFSYPFADFSQASVTMRSNGTTIPLAIEYYSAAWVLPDATIVWIPNGMDTTRGETWPVPAADQPVEVTVSNVRISGQSRTFNYTVTIFDAAAAGPEEYPLAVTPRRFPVVGLPASFAVATRPWSEGVQGRLIEVKPYDEVHGAEENDNPFIESVSPGYNTVQGSRVASGSKAFHLANPDGERQTLTLPDAFLIGEGASLSFNSSLAWATENQYASVDINLGDGDAWIPIWIAAGPVNANNPDFDFVSLDLAPWSGSTARFRFRYDYTGGLYYIDSKSWAGWAFDDVRLDGVSRLTQVEELPVVPGASSFTHTFAESGTCYLQARTYAFGGYALEWGPLLQLEPCTVAGVDLADGEWHWNPVLGWLYGTGTDWLYSPTMGYINTAGFPWILAESGWIQYLQGSLDTGMWLYHPEHGFAFTSADLGGELILSPFTQGAVRLSFTSR